MSGDLTGLCLYMTEELRPGCFSIHQNTCDFCELLSSSSLQHLSICLKTSSSIRPSKVWLLSEDFQMFWDLKQFVSHFHKKSKTFRRTKPAAEISTLLMFLKLTVKGFYFFIFFFIFFFFLDSTGIDLPTLGAVSRRICTVKGFYKMRVYMSRN